MYGYWTIDWYFYITIAYAVLSVVNWFVREKKGYADFRPEADSEGGDE